MQTDIEYHYELLCTQISTTWNLNRLRKEVVYKTIQPDGIVQRVIGSMFMLGLSRHFVIPRKMDAELIKYALWCPTCKLVLITLFHVSFSTELDSRIHVLIN